MIYGITITAMTDTLTFSLTEDDTPSGVVFL